MTDNIRDRLIQRAHKLRYLEDSYVTTRFGTSTRKFALVPLDDAKAIADEIDEFVRLYSPESSQKRWGEECTWDINDYGYWEKVDDKLKQG